MFATWFILLDGELFKKGIDDDILFRCLRRMEAMRVMTEIHKGICGAHQTRVKMKWLLWRHSYYWTRMLKDCISYAKGCQEFQKHGPIHKVPAKELQSIIKPWPFSGWAIDLIGKIYPPSSGQHCFIIIAIDYFTKWVEAIPMRSVT